MVVINKVDRDTSRVDDVETEVFDLMCSLGATDDQLEYTTGSSSSIRSQSIVSGFEV